MIRNVRGTIPASKLINKTSKTLHLYEDSTGNIKRFPVSDERLPDSPRFGAYYGPGFCFYVVSKDEYEKLSHARRCLDDIAVQWSSSPGRRGKMMDRLVWGKDPNVTIYYRGNMALYNTY